MQNRTTLFIGIGLITLGVIAIFNILFHVNLWSFLFPLFIIGVGLFILLRPKTIDSNTNFVFRPLGEVNFTNQWQVTPQEIWFFVGDANLDFSQALIPTGTTKIRLFGFVGDIRIRESKDAGLKVVSRAFITDSRVLGDKRDHFLNSMVYISPDFEPQDKKIEVESWFFVGEIRVE